MPSKRHVHLSIGMAFIVAALTAASANHAAAQGYPSQVIHIEVPTTPATPPDIISRVVANEISKSEGWKVIVENKPGASMTIAAEDVLSKPADGYTILAMSVPITAAPAILPHVPYKLTSAFDPVVKISTSYNVLVVNPSVPAHSVSDLVALLKKNPGKLTFSSGGFGTPAHLIGEMFMLEEGVKAVHVPYQQFPQAIADLLNGTNQFMFITTLPVVNLIKASKLRALAVTGPKRLAALPNVPTVVEEGHPKLVAADWVGFAVKHGTPKAIVLKLNHAVNDALNKRSVRESIEKLGAEPTGGTPEEYGKLLKSEVVHWAQVVKDSGMKTQK